ncbi:MAG: P-loop NTPase fold protein [Actinomadura sp.]
MNRRRADRRERQEVFEEALEAALEDLQEEADDRLDDAATTELRVDELTERAYRHQAKAFAQATADEAEKAYRQAVADATIPWSGRPLLGLLRCTIVIAFLGSLLGAAVMYGYSAALSGPPGSFNDVSVLSLAVLGRAPLPLLGLLALGLAVYLPVWRTTALRRDALVAGTAVTATAATLLLTFSTRGVIVNMSGSDAGPGWELLVLIVTAMTDIFFFTTPVREWWLTLTDRGAIGGRRNVMRQRRVEWRDELAEPLKAILRPAIDAHRFERTLNLQDAPGLRRVRDTTLHVRTKAEESLVEVSRGMDGGSIAISGPRGVGKTELLEAFCAGPDVVARAPVGMSVVVTAPVVYDRREFILHLFTELCEAARTLDAKPLRQEAAKHLQRIRYLQTTSSETAWNATVRGLGFRRARGRLLARQPLTYPEIVKAFKGFLTVVAAHVTSLGDGAGLLVIGIDELDRIQPAAGAREFLNEIKVIFDVRNCLFVLSVSDDALHEAELAPVGRRDVFDSAVDEVVRVEPLDQEGAVALLNPRVYGGVPEAFAALFNCLSGGIPRDLLRTARAALLFTEEDGPQQEELPETAERLVERELARITSSLAAGVPPELSGPLPGRLLRDGSLLSFGERITEKAATTANRLFFLDTVLGVFSPNLTGDMIRTASGQAPRDVRSFTALAKTASYIGVDDLQALASLQAVRAAWGLPPLPGPGGSSALS